MVRQSRPELAARRRVLLRRSDSLRGRIVVDGQQLEPTLAIVDRVRGGLQALRHNRMAWIAAGAAVVGATALRPGLAARLGRGAWAASRLAMGSRSLLRHLLAPRR